jgi:hypothetical protein
MNDETFSKLVEQVTGEKRPVTNPGEITHIPLKPPFTELEFLYASEVHDNDQNGWTDVYRLRPLAGTLVYFYADPATYMLRPIKIDVMGGDPVKLQLSHKF